MSEILQIYQTSLSQKELTKRHCNVTFKYSNPSSNSNIFNLIWILFLDTEKNIENVKADT